jgi:tRNA A-37 threonylcarbamoyl transferase component Bud32
MNAASSTIPAAGLVPAHDGDPQAGLPPEVHALLSARRWAEAAAVPLDAAGRLERCRAFGRYGRGGDAAADLVALERLAGVLPGDSVAGDLSAVPHAVAVERGLLALRGAEPAERLLPSAVEALADASLDARTRARALLLRGLAEHRLDLAQQALRHLVEGLAAAERAGDVGTRIELLMAIATVQSWRGRHSHALLKLTLAMADCAVLGDALLLAKLLGELARVNLELRRYDHAHELLERQDRLAGDWLDERGLVRLGLSRVQALIGLGEYQPAAAAATALLARAEAAGYRYLSFVAARDLAVAELRGGHAAAGAAALARAADHAGADASYERLALNAVRAELAVAKGNAGAAELAAGVVAGFAERQLVAPEVEARLVEAAALLARGDDAGAGRTLRVALGRARAHELALLEERVRATMARVGATLGLDDERGRTVATTFAAAPDGYVLLEKLGAGGYGSVFRVYDMERGREVALKRLSALDRYAGMERDRLLASARAEYELAARVSHPGIARVIALGTTDDGGIYVVQEFVAGPSLRDTMALAPQDEARRAATVAATLRRIAQALEALHAAGIAHRDIKPDNILCPSPDRPVLVDLGIAGGFATAASSTAAPLSVDSRGTAAYAAPEQWRGEPADARADLYSLGVVAFEWLTGRLPTPAAARTSAFPWRRNGLSAEDRQALESAAAPVPNLAGTIAAMMDARPDRRPQSARDVVERLESG